MKKQKIWKIICILMFILCAINLIYLNSESHSIKKTSNVLYGVDRLSIEDVENMSTFKSCFAAQDDETGELEVKYKKLYGAERLMDYKLDEDGGIQVDFASEDTAKILIFDEEGNQRFYKEVSQLNFEPGESGEYSIYAVAKGFTGEIVCSTY